MMDFAGNVEFVSAGSNAEPGAVDCINGLLVYGAGNNVLLVHLDHPEIPAVALPSGPASGRVHAVKLICNDSSDVIGIVAGASDASVKFWTKKNNDPHWSLFFDTKLTASVQSICSVPLACASASSELLSSDLSCPAVVASACIDGTVAFFAFSPSGVQQVPDCLKFTSKKVTAIALATLPLPQDSASNSSHDDTRTLPCPPPIALFCSLTDSSIHVLVQDKRTNSGRDVLTSALDFGQKIILSGHQNWITSMDTVKTADGIVHLASAGADRTVRLWRLTDCTFKSADVGLAELVPKRNRFGLVGREYMVENEAILFGHEGAVHSVKWVGETADRLISSSADRTVIVWAPLSDASGGIWSSQLQVGDIGGIGSVGAGHAFGLHNAFWLSFPRENIILANGSSGSIQVWSQDKDNLADDGWQMGIPITGHAGPVESCCWDAKGCVLLTASQDQTARAIACWKRSDGQPAHGSFTWHEIGRPQIHGYDMQHITCIPDDGPLRYISCADEKVIRVFTSTRAFKKRLDAVTTGTAASLDEADLAALAVSVPALGLSNKAATATLSNNNDDGEEGAGGHGAATASMRKSHDGQDTSAPSTGAKLIIDRPPTEPELSRQTLWPEIEKLYGHGYEVFCTAISHDGRLVASASKATTAADAAVRFWRASDWKPVVSAPVMAHSLTITRMAFSPDDRYLLAVSRDRSWSIIECSMGGGGDDVPFRVVQRVEGAHSRIIWTGKWSPAGDFFVTSSRDKKIRTWARLDAARPEWSCVDTFEAPNGVNSFDIFPRALSSFGFGLLAAAGLEDGSILIMARSALSSGSGGSGGSKWSVIQTIDAHGIAPSMTVNDLQWRPVVDDTAAARVTLAAVSADHSTRLYSWSPSQLDALARHCSPRETS